MSSSVFTETSSARIVADADSNLVVVYGKNGISFDERAIENLMEEKSISTISVVRITSPTPSMLDQEEAERLEELEQFLEANHTDRDDSDNDDSDDEDGSQSDEGDNDVDNSDGVEIKSEMDHITGDDEENSSNIGGGIYNDDSTETETEAVKVKKRPGRKPKKIKKRKRRKPKERPQVVGLSVEQFYAETTADMVVKNALKLAGLSIFKRTPETDAILEIIKNDHNYTPFTSPEQMRNHKMAERLAMERQTAQSRKLIMQAPPGNIKVFNAKRRTLAPAIQAKSQKQHPLPKEKQDPYAVRTIHRSGRNLVKVIAPPPPPIPVDEHIEDDEHAHSSDLDTEGISEGSEDSRESDNDRDSDMDFNISRNSRISSKKRQRVKVPLRRNKQPGKQLPPPTILTIPSNPGPTLATAPPSASVHHRQFSDPSLRKKPRIVVADSTPKIGQIIQLPANKAPPTVIALGRNIQSTSFLKMRPQTQHHGQAVIKKMPHMGVGGKEVIRLPLPVANVASPTAPVTTAKVRQAMPIVQVTRAINPMPTSVFTTPPPQEIKEIVINKNIASPKGVFTNLNSLLGENSKMKSTASPTSSSSLTEPRHLSPSNPNRSTAPIMQPFNNKGFMPIGVETASSHKLPAQIVIETHQSSSELAAENDKQLDLINSIVQDELLKSSLVEQTPVNVDESIPKLVKMLESTAEGLDQTTACQSSTFNHPNPNGPITMDTMDMVNAAPLLETPDEDEITADFLQHVVGLIEEDKQFEAEVVKQVLASTELDVINSAVNLLDSVPVLESVPPTLQQLEVQLKDQSIPPMASSTPSRSGDPDLSQIDTNKIVRGNGRIIYLPPIEAPTTRAKRRAQNTTTTGSMDLSNISLNDYMMDSSSSSMSNEQLAGTSVIKRTNPREPSMARRPAMPRRSHNKLLTSQTTDAEASESQEDDDDPNKLWCICRQPHNNRFMICCDLCEDWYHGTCVNVTKSMGLDMEQKGIDWKCPKCVKKKEEKCQPRITDMLTIQGTGAVTNTESAQPKRTAPFNIAPGNASPQAKQSIRRMPTTIMTMPTTTATAMASTTTTPSTSAASPTVTKVLHQQQLNFIKLGGSGAVERTVCVVCKRSIRLDSSIYCSDECIRKYVNAAIQQQISPKTPDTSPALPLSPTSGSNLTTDPKKNKKKDLFEDMLRQADKSMPKVDRINVFERRTGRTITGHLAPTAQHLKKWLQDNPTFEILSLPNVEKQQLKRIPPTPETIVVKPRALAEVTAKTDSTQLTQLSVNPLLSRKEREKEKTPVAKLASPVRTGSIKTEPIRINVRRTLKEQLLARIKEAQEANTKIAIEWLTALEVEQFAKCVELEMYQSFGRDVGAKYKSKYRSLMFNIKDRKNKTLFEKICAKQVEPKQLVRMTPEQLASQELAKWREEENRHQLDMIKKSELDLLNRSQNYVVKTHKGEEMIDTKMDVILPDEDVQKQTEQLKTEVKLSQSQSQSQSHSQSSETDVSHDRSSSKEKRHKSHKHHHHHHHHHHHRHHQRNRSRSRSHSRSRSLEKRHRRHNHNDLDKVDGKDDESTSASPLTTSSSPLPKKILEKKTEETPSKPLTTYNLIDQILESEKTVEQAANLKLPIKQTSHKTPAKVQPTPPLDKYVHYLQGVETWATPLWSGNLSMIDVADFQVVIHPILGNCQHLSKLLPKKLDVIGRITRVNVWEYIKKIKKSPTKEVVIVSLFPSGPSETTIFDQFYEYLDTRQRLGVLGTESDQIRDFYIFPLGSDNSLPSALQTSERVPFYEDTKRPNTLLGIIVRCLSKRSGAVPLSINTSVSTISTNTSSSSSSTTTSKKSRSAATFTPPSSPKRKRSSHSTSSKDDEFDIDAIIKAPIAKLQKTSAAVVEPTANPLDIPVDDPNAPYSPGGSSDNEASVNSSTIPRPDDLERQVHEINKQIAAQQKEIAGLLNVEPSGLTKPSSSSNILASISIPPDLSKILASIKESSDTTTQANAIDTANEEYKPEDAMSTNSSYPAQNKTRRRLAQLTEAELLSMVPDNLVDVAATPPPTTSNTNRYQH